MAKIDWAAEVVELRRRFHEHQRAIAAGDRSPELLAAIRADADVMACCLEEASPNGSWVALHDEMRDLVKRAAV